MKAGLGTRRGVICKRPVPPGEGAWLLGAVLKGREDKGVKRTKREGKGRDHRIPFKVKRVCIKGGMGGWGTG